MKKILVTLFTAFILLPAFTQIAVAASDEELMETCKSYAKDEGITQEEMADYLANCVEDLKAAEKEKN